MDMDMQENTAHEQKAPAGKGLATPSLAFVILLSFLFGGLGGIFGVRYALNNPSILRLVGSNAGGTSLSQTVTLNEDSAVVDVVKKASPAVVSIVVTKDLSRIPGYGLDPFSDDFFNYFFGRQQQTQPNVQQVGAGSGFFVSSDGYIITNRHVVDDEQASYTVITNDGKRFEAKVLARDPRNDLAIIKIDIKDAHKLDWADSAQLQVGQKVIAIGNSLGQYQNTVTTGVVSGIGRSITAGGQGGSEQLEGVIQTDTAINPGNSGGPLLNVAGQVIGINTAVDRQGQLVGFAIPANDARRALESYQRSGAITRPYLGVRYIQITKELAAQENLPRDYGALILRGQSMADFAVIPGSPADKAGLQENDIILEVNGTRIGEDNTLTRLLKDKNAGDQLELKVYHWGEEKMLRVTLEEQK